MNAVTSLLAALVGAFLFERLAVPSGALLGAMVGVTVHNLAWQQVVALPKPVTFFAYAALGWAIGFGVTRDSLGELQRAALPILGVVVALLVAGGLVSLLLVQLAGIDVTTAYLAASPGALSQMTVLSKETGSDTLLVVTVHTVRVIAVLLAAPLVTRWLT